MIVTAIANRLALNGFRATAGQFPENSSLHPNPADDVKAARVSNAARSVETAFEKAKDLRRSFAAERVRQLRERLQVLRWFASASPKVAARLAVRMSYDLKAAVGDYSKPGLSPLPPPVEVQGARANESGEDIRVRLRAQLEDLKARKAAFDSAPRDKAFITEAATLRFGIQGLVEAARPGWREDPSIRRDIHVATLALGEVDRTLNGMGGRALSVFV